MNRRAMMWTAVLAAGAAASTAAGQLHTGDMVLTVSGGRVVVNGVDGGGAVVPNRVFADRFGKLGPSLPNRTPDPGLNAVGGQFVAGQPVGVTIGRAARVWTPAPGGGGDFCVIPEERIQIRKSGFTIETPAADPASPDAGPSIELGVTDPLDGQFHEHGVYWLTAPFDAAVYLLELRVWAGAPGGSGPVQPSDPVWILFNQDRPQQEVDDALAWLRSSLAGAPQPGGPLCPVPACACDWNRSGGLTVQDVFDFLAAYFGGAADANGDGATSVQDIFDFLACYFDGCG